MSERREGEGGRDMGEGYVGWRGVMERGNGEGRWRGWRETGDQK